MQQKVNSSDSQNIWDRFKSGDQEAFAVLYNLHVDPLYSYGIKLCKDEEAVKDTLQELFLELFLNREKIKIGSDSLRFYLLLALKRSLIKKIKGSRKLSQVFNESLDFMPEYSIEFQIIEGEREAEINRRVSNALNQLPAKQKEAIYLRFNLSLEYAEIADILEITVESVRKQVHRALKSIREIIREKQIITFFFRRFLLR